MYSGVPPAKTPVAPARPKSATLHPKLLSTRMLEGLMSLWTTSGSALWRKAIPLTMSSAHRTSVAMSNGMASSITSCMEPCWRSSVTRHRSPLWGSLQAAISITMFGCRSLAICRISSLSIFSARLCPCREAPAPNVTCWLTAAANDRAEAVAPGDRVPPDPPLAPSNSFDTILTATQDPRNLALTTLPKAPAPSSSAPSIPSSSLYSIRQFSASSRSRDMRRL